MARRRGIRTSTDVIRDAGHRARMEALARGASDEEANRAADEAAEYLEQEMIAEDAALDELY